MSAPGQNVDELIMCLVGMGFDLEDCQQAVSNGKLSVESAIEWILAGKPSTQGSSASTLRLAQNRTEGVLGSNPFSNPQPLPDHPQPVTSQDPLTSQPDVKIVSRAHLNEEQRKIKERFEEKQREEARRSAQQEKVAQKKAHEAALQQIKADREKIKSKKAQTSPAKDENSTGPSSSPISSPTKPKLTMLQIRLPDGRALKQSFDPGAYLQEVWDFVSDTCSTAGMCFMQPFPRQEFTEEHLGASLQQLGLFPTGSLVLKKNENKPTAMETETSSEGRSISTPTSPPAVPLHPQGVSINLPSPPGLPLLSPMTSPHQWGTGSKLDEEGVSGPGAEEEGSAMVVEEQDNEEEMEEEGALALPPVPAHLPAHPPMGGWHPMGQDHTWGGGQSLMGEVLQQDIFPHHRKDPKQLAAEAASTRVAMRPVEAAAEEAIPPSHLMAIPSLTQMIIEHITGRICDTRQPILSLQGIPAEIATKILNHLIQSRLLKPKTLHPFISSHLVKLLLDCYPYTTNELLSAIRLHTYLIHLSLSSCPLITDKGLLLLNSLKRLKVLNLGNCTQLTNNCMQLLKELESLVTLSVENTGVCDEGVTHYAESCPPCLTHLNLSHTAVTHNIFKALKLIQGLKSLNLEETHVASLSGIEELSGLEVLNLCNTPIVTDSLLCLNGHPSLSALNISNTQNVNGDLALQYIKNLRLHYLQLPSRLSTSSHGISFLTGMPLITLDLTNYINVGDEAMLYISQIHSLKKLRLSNTKVTDAGMTNLQGLTNLQELLLDRTLIGNEGAAAVQDMCQLQELSLSETRITNGFLKSRCLANCFLLSKLNLSRTGLTDAGIKALKLPNLSLLNLDGTMVRAEIEWYVRENCPTLQNISMKNLALPPSNDDDDEL